MDIINLNPKDSQEAIEGHLGTPGRLLSASKSMYREKFPDHKIYFNACLFDKEFKQVWYGDIDLDIDKESLQMLANYLKEPIYLTIEQPFRFDGLKEEHIDTDDVIVFVPQDKNAPKEDENGNNI